jgi:hypothetical protein
VSDASDAVSDASDAVSDASDAVSDVSDAVSDRSDAASDLSDVLPDRSDVTPETSGNSGNLLTGVQGGCILPLSRRVPPDIASRFHADGSPQALVGA